MQLALKEYSPALTLVQNYVRRLTSRGRRSTVVLLLAVSTILYFMLSYMRIVDINWLVGSDNTSQPVGIHEVLGLRQSC